MKSFKTLPVAAASFVMVGLAALTPGHASTETAVTVSGLNMRTGPGPQYPVVSVLPENTAVSVSGCTASSSWCEVSFGPARGWVYSKYLQISFDDELVVVTPAVTTSLGLTVVGYNYNHGNDNGNGHNGGGNNGGGNNGGGNNGGNNGGGNGGQDEDQGFFRFFNIFGEDDNVAVGVTDNAVIGAKVDESRRGKRTVTAVKCDKGGCNTVLKAEKNPNGKGFFSLNFSNGEKSTSIDAEQTRRGKRSITAEKCNGGDCETILEAEKKQNGKGFFSFNIGNGEKSTSINAEQSRRGERTINATKRNGDNTAEVELEKNRRGKRTLTVEKCTGGDCKGVVVSKDQNGDGKPDVNPVSYDRSSNKSRDNANAGSSRGSRDASSGGRSRGGGFSRDSRGSRNNGNRRG